jgi:hypothetical protein
LKNRVKKAGISSVNKTWTNRTLHLPIKDKLLLGKGLGYILYHLLLLGLLVVVFVGVLLAVFVVMVVLLWFLVLNTILVVLFIIFVVFLERTLRHGGRMAKSKSARVKVGNKGNDGEQ